MIQKKYKEIKKAGNWTLYQVSYYYNNELCMYYELHSQNNITKKENHISFGQRKYDDLKKMIGELNDEAIDLRNISIKNHETVIMDPVLYKT